MARAEFVPTEQDKRTVQVMAACGVPHPSICQAIVNPESARPIDAKTLRKVFKDELKNPRQAVVGKVAMSLYQKAVGDGPQSVTAAIFYLKTQGGWREPDGPAADDDPPLPTKVVIEVRDARRPAPAAEKQPALE